MTPPLPSPPSPSRLPLALQDKSAFDVKGLVRSKASSKKRVPEASDADLVVGDVLADPPEKLRRELEGVDTLVILTSAVRGGGVGGDEHSCPMSLEKLFKIRYLERPCMTSGVFPPCQWVDQDSLSFPSH